MCVCVGDCVLGVMFVEQTFTCTNTHTHTHTHTHTLSYSHFLPLSLTQIHLQGRQFAVAVIYPLTFIPPNKVDNTTHREIERGRRERDRERREIERGWRDEGDRERKERG